MEFRSTKPISRMGAGFGDTSEIINVDSLRMMHIGVNHGKKQAQFVFAFGGYDTQGVFHMVPDATLALAQVNLTYQVPGEKEIWEASLQDEKGNPVTEHDAAVVKVLVDHGQLAKMLNGAGWKIKGLELQHNGVTVGAQNAKGVFVMAEKAIEKAS